jgi:hypothetical protein
VLPHNSYDPGTAVSEFFKQHRANLDAAERAKPPRKPISDVPTSGRMPKTPGWV